MRLRGGIVVDERSPELEKINNYICSMYAKKNYKPMYGNGGAIKYQDGGPVKSDSTNVSLMDKLNSLRGSEGIDLFGMEAVLDARRKRDAEMEGLSEVDKLRKLFGIPEGGADLDLFGIEAVLDAREAAGLSRNPLDDLKPISDAGKEMLEKLRVYFGISDDSNKNMMKEIRPKEYRMGGTIKYRSGGKFPDLTGDGKVTMADILKGRGVGK